MEEFTSFPLSQARCHNCGFLAVWKLPEQELEEAPEFYRKHGGLEFLGGDKRICPPKCFIRKADLQLEVDEDPGSLFGYSEVVKDRIQHDRSCTYFTPWIQGFHPKEHKQMLLNEAMLEDQRKHAQHSLYTAIATAIFTGLAVFAGSIVTYCSADLESKATIKAAEMQIEAQKEIARIEASKPAPPINVVVQIPEATASKKPGRK